MVERDGAGGGWVRDREEGNLPGAAIRRQGPFTGACGLGQNRKQLLQRKRQGTLLKGENIVGILTLGDNTAVFKVK